MPKVKGSTIVPRLEYIKQKGGNLEKILAKINPDFAAELKKGILINQWYDFNGYLEFSRSIDQVLGTGDLSVVVDMARYSAKYAAQGVYKMFYKIGSPEWTMKMGLLVWKQYYDTGKARSIIEKVEHGKSGRVCIEDFPISGELAPVFWKVLCGWLEGSLELSGGKNGKVTKAEKNVYPTSTAEFCLQWD